MAEGFTSGGGGYRAAYDRVGQALQEGLVSSADVPAIFAEMRRMFVDLANSTGNGAYLDGMQPGVDYRFADSGHGFVALHSGGVVGMDRPMSLNRPGGLRSDEYLRVLQKGEGVFTPGQMAALGGAGGPTIIINIGKVNASNSGEVNTMAQSMSRELAVALRGTV